MFFKYFFQNKQTSPQITRFNKFYAPCYPFKEKLDLKSSSTDLFLVEEHVVLWKSYLRHVLRKAALDCEVKTPIVIIILLVMNNTNSISTLP